MTVEIQDELQEVLNEQHQEIQEVAEPQEQIEEVAEETQPEDPKPEVKQEKKKLTFEERQAQIAKQIREKHEVQRAIESEREKIRQEREELEALRKQYGANKDLPPDPSKFDPEKPEEYVEAVAEWKAEQKIKAFEKQNEEKRAQAEALKAQNEIQSKWELKAQAKLQKDPSFAEAEQNVVMVLQQQPNRDMYFALMEEDNSADLVDYLGKNLEECIRISALNGISAAKEIGKLAVKIQGRQSQTVSKAPAPTSGLKQSGNVGVRDIANMSYEEYSKLMNKKQYGF